MERSSQTEIFPRNLGSHITFQLCGAAGKAIYTLREFAGEDGDIADPASRDENFFRETCALIKRTLEQALPRLLEHAANR